MDAIDILRDGLKGLGANGLCCEDCGCHVDDLAPCYNYFGACVPAKAVPRAVARDYGYTGEADCDEIMIPLAAKLLPKIPCDKCGSEWLEDDLVWTGTRHICDGCRSNEN